MSRTPPARPAEPRDRPRKARGLRRERAHAADDGGALARAAAELGLARKAQDVVVLDLRAVVPRPEVDFFVLMNSVSEPHQRALADHILEELDRRGIRHLHLEGYPSSGWILIDFVDVVVHIFRPDSREFYALETLWGDAPGERLEDDPRGTRSAPLREAAPPPPVRGPRPKRTATPSRRPPAHTASKRPGVPREAAPPRGRRPARPGRRSVRRRGDS